MAFWKSLFKQRKPFGLYKGGDAFSHSFSDQIKSMFSFAAPQEPFKAASEEDVWREANQDIDNAVKSFNSKK